MQNENTDRQDQEIRALLKDFPMPEASADFYDRSLLRATHEGTRRQRNRWLMTGFGSAVAAGLALWAIGMMFLANPELPLPEAALPGVTMTLAEPQTVNLIFASAEALDSATLTVRLPDGIELSGFPGQREVTWQTSLTAGRNLLPLKLIATSPIGGEVHASLVHNNRGRTFRLRVDVG
ncbi:MAG TPA: hypothetical protein PKH39_09140 [Woeseiaceae bacterium]|nr:hypothetical protein [Woeseiaceae bacterium]